MKRKYQFVSSSRDGPLSPMSTKLKGTGARLSSGARRRLRRVFHAMAIALIATTASNAHAQLQGGNVTAGSATIQSSPGNTTINQSTPKAAINWQRFDVNTGESVRFIQPDGNSIALNRVLGSNPSNIMGELSANGQVFLLNPHGVLFGKGAQVNVGGLVASTLGISDSDFMAGRYQFSGTGSGSVLNQGSINADGGYVAMLGANVSNEGVISARLGTVALAAGNAVTLDLAGDGLLNVALDQGTANALVENSGHITADGGSVLMTTQAAGQAVQGVVNNTGVVQAQTIKKRNGKIMLMGDMDSGTVNVAGTLDASAPNSGDGGFIETSAANVNLADNRLVTTLSKQGKTGTWLIDPIDFTIADSGGDITGEQLAIDLGEGNVEIDTDGTGGNGDIFVDDVVTWDSSNSLTLTADRDIEVNEAITNDGGGNLTMNADRDIAMNGAITLSNGGSLEMLAGQDVNVGSAISVTGGNVVVCCGRDINTSDDITTTNGSIFLGAGRDITTNGALTATDGNIAMCAADDVTIGDTVTVTNGSTTSGESLGLPVGLTVVAGLDGSGPGSGSGTVSISGTNSITTTGEPPMATIYYNPSSYDSTSNFTSNFTGTGGDPREIMWVYPEVEDKVENGTTANLIGLRGDLGSFDVELSGSGTANFDDPSVGDNKLVTFTGFSLDGADADNFALMSGSFGSFPTDCCNFQGRTTGNIVAASTPPDEPTPTEDTGGSDTQTPTPPPPPVAPAPTPDTTPPPSVLPTLSNDVPQIVASTLPAVAFSPPAGGGVNPNLARTGIKMPPPVELVQIEAVQPEATEPQELAPKPDRH